jgi:hypothetical protein
MPKKRKSFGDENGVSTSSTRAFMSGFSNEVYLSRSGSGPWKFDRIGKRMIL